MSATNARKAPGDHSKRDIWDLRWVREPQQDRSARTRTQLLDATVRVLEADGLEGLTIARVASEASCSVGSLYHHFQDKQTIIYAVLDRMARETSLTAEEGLKLSRWEGVPLMGILDGYLRYSLKLNRQFSGVIQAQRALAMHDANVESRMHESAKQTRALIMRLIRPRLFEVNHPDPNLAVGVMLNTLRAALGQRAQANRPGARPLNPKQSDESFIREMLKMAAAYLGVA